MMSPYGAAEKQALLEAPDLKTRAEILVAVTEIELAKKTAGERRDAAAVTARRAIRCRDSCWSRHDHHHATERPAGSVDPKLLEILVCPLTKGPLEYDAEKQELISRAAKLAYPIRDGIPIMLPEEARRLD